MLSSVFLFLNIGTGEMVLILFAALMLFGGNKLPELARGLGKGIRDFKDASEDVKREINNQINNYEEKKVESKVEEIKPEENTYEPVAGTISAYETHSATDAIEEPITADDTPVDVVAGASADNYQFDAEVKSPSDETTPANVVSGASADNYQFDAEVKHPVTGSRNATTGTDEAEEPVKKTIEEEYK
jgi:sec-independent protein translocase protein TatA